MGAQEFFRAATVQGSCDTVALGPEPGHTPVEVTELVTGGTQRATLTLAAPAKVPLRAMPAVQVWEPARLQAILKAPGATVYVDGRQGEQLAPAQALAKRLGATGDARSAHR